MYRVHEIFYSLQGEGFNSGRAAVFCRFSGCNLWSGTEADRAAARCQLCDTVFAGEPGDGGGAYGTANEVALAVDRYWPARAGNGAVKLVICTGGEPLLQLDAALLTALHDRGFAVAVETNGTVAAPDGIDWLCVSPKAGTELAVTRGNELKLVYPQAGLEPAALLHLAFDHFFLQPCAGPKQAENTAAALDYCREHPRWRLGLQTQKILGIK